MNTKLTAEMETINIAMAVRADEINVRLESDQAPFRIRYTQNFKDGLYLDGYILESMDIAKNCNPVVYLDSWWNGTNEEIEEYLWNVFDTNVTCINASIFEDRDYILSHVHAKLVSASKVDEIRSRDIVAIPYMDMLCLFYVTIDSMSKDDVISSTTVNYPLMEHVGIGVEELFEAAKNRIAEEVRFTSMEAMLGMMTGEEEFDFGIPSFFVITNEHQMYGAACLLSPELIAECEMKVGCACYLLPSSIHEIIAVPAILAADVDELRAMVTEINGSGVVEEKDILTNSVYCLEDGEIRIC